MARFYSPNTRNPYAVLLRWSTTWCLIMTNIAGTARPAISILDLSDHRERQDTNCLCSCPVARPCGRGFTSAVLSLPCNSAMLRPSCLPPSARSYGTRPYRAYQMPNRQTDGRLVLACLDILAEHYSEPQGSRFVSGIRWVVAAASGR